MCLTNGTRKHACSGHQSIRYAVEKCDNIRAIIKNSAISALLQTSWGVCQCKNMKIDQYITIIITGTYNPKVVQKLKEEIKK